MFRVRKSIQRFSKDSAWSHEKHATTYLRETFDLHGYPFSRGQAGNNAEDLFQGVIEGYPATLFHHTAWYFRTGSGGTSAKGWRNFSVATLTLPRTLPATAVVVGAQAAEFNHKTEPALPSDAGEAKHLSGGGQGSALEQCTVDLAFGELAISDEVKRITSEAGIGWRIDGNRIIGWVVGRKPVDEIQKIAENLTDIVRAFPKQAWQWPATGTEAHT